jgi:hypothetical protein
MMRRETYRIVQSFGYPRWIAFRKEPGRVAHVYVGHAHTRDFVRELVQRDRIERRRDHHGTTAAFSTSPFHRLTS